MAVTFHADSCCRNHEVAVNVIKGYEGSVEVSELTAEAYEHSEMLLYKASLLEEGGNPQAALEQLDASKARRLHPSRYHGTYVALSSDMRQAKFPWNASALRGAWRSCAARSPRAVCLTHV